MNPHMWAHPATRRNVQILTDRGCIFVQPESGRVACGDSGEGKLADVFDIQFMAARALLPQDMAGKTVLLTLGPTREPWDSVRIWTNLSTGRMGAALAQAAFLRGATVHAVAGPGSPRLPAGIVRHDVITAEEMFAAAGSLWSQADYGLCTAAVADFSPEPYGPAKCKKRNHQEGLSVRFTPNQDILATLGGTAREGQRILGFAAETENLVQEARAKLLRKKAHMIVGNLVGMPGAGFASATNSVFVCDHQGREEQWPQMRKEDVAWGVLDWLLTL
jgi:phosphopantothenoylcysteine decarboxylase/phosphopantothenate--cysteine ligase